MVVSFTSLHTSVHTHRVLIALQKKTAGTDCKKLGGSFPWFPPPMDAYYSSKNSPQKKRVLIVAITKCFSIVTKI